MKRLLLSALLLLAATAGAQGLTAKLDSVYRYYVVQDYDAAGMLLQRLDQTVTSPADRFVVKLELGDFLLDKRDDYAGAESLYNLILDQFPRDKRKPDVMYRLALAQEMQEKFLDAAKNYEQVATRYMKSTYGADALDAIERCFRKNYQDRVAYVDGFPITRIELDERISRYPAAYEQYERKAQLLDTMIDNRLLYEAAEAAGIFEDPEFTESLAQLRNRFVFEQWYADEVTDKAEPTEKALQAQYRKDRASKYTTPEKVHGYQIVVPDKRLADSLRKALLADTTQAAWDSAAMAHSTAPDKERGGDMGLFARGIQPKPVENAAFRLKPGQISQPVKTEQGFVIIKVTDKQPTIVRKYEEVKNQILVQMRQENTNRLYEEKTEELKSRVTVVTDSNAIAEDKDTLAVVDGVAITSSDLAERIKQIPTFFRAQFESPEGKQRILDQIILENLILRDCEAKKVWLRNKVVDRVLEQHNRMAIDRYRNLMVTDKIELDPTEAKDEYKSNIKEYEVPAQVHLKEIVTNSRSRADQLRTWARAERLPAMLEGKALLVLDKAKADEVKKTLMETANADSLISLHALAGRQTIPGTPTTKAGGKEVPNIALSSRGSGPYKNTTELGLGFTDLSSGDELFAPVPQKVETAEELAVLEGRELKTDTTGMPITDSARLGIYVTLDKPLPSAFVKGLFKLDVGDVAEHELPEGMLLVKVTKKDTAQKTTFAELARRFSTSGSKWSGGDLNWLNRDDKAHDPKLLATGFDLSTGSVSKVMKLADTAYAFIKVEEKKEAYTQPFDEVKPKIEEQIRQSKRNALYDELLSGLRDKADIEILMKESDFVFETEPVEAAPDEEEEQEGENE